MRTLKRASNYSDPYILRFLDLPYTTCTALVAVHTNSGSSIDSLTNRHSISRPRSLQSIVSIHSKYNHQNVLAFNHFRCDFAGNCCGGRAVRRTSPSRWSGPLVSCSKPQQHLARSSSWLLCGHCRLSVPPWCQIPRPWRVQRMAIPLLQGPWSQSRAVYHC